MAVWTAQRIENPVYNSGTAAAAAANSVALPAAANLTTWIAGFTVTSAAPASTVAGLVTVSGLATSLGSKGTLSFEFVESSTMGGQLVVEFPFLLPASAQNSAITVALAAITSGAATAVSAYGALA